MPYLNVQTNVDLNTASLEALVLQASSCVSELLGKPEDYVMVAIAGGVMMRFAASAEPCAYLELHSLGMSETQAKACVAALSEMVGGMLGVPPDRIYVNCQAAERAMWGWNGETFG